MEKEHQTPSFKKIGEDLSRFEVVPRGVRIHSWSEAVEMLKDKLNENVNPKYGPVQMGRIFRELKILGVSNAGGVLDLMKQCREAPCSFGQAYGQRLKTARQRQADATPATTSPKRLASSEKNRLKAKAKFPGLYQS